MGLWFLEAPSRQLYAALRSSRLFMKLYLCLQKTKSKSNSMAGVVVATLGINSDPSVYMLFMTRQGTVN